MPSLSDYLMGFLPEVLLVVVSILIGVVATNLFHRLREKEGGPARLGGEEQAKDELLGLIQSYIVNKQEFSEQSIRNLMAASERQYQVQLMDAYTPVTLLQDVLLTLQQSKHLDVPQKIQYVSQIEDKISAFQRTSKGGAIGG